MKEKFLSLLRDRTLPCETFRKAAGNLSSLIASEVAEELDIKKQKIILIPILRAGLVFLPAFQELFTSARIGFLGIRRDEKTALPHLYYENLPSLSPDDQIILLDPMLATGGSANLAIDLLKSRGGANIFLVSALAAPEGYNAVKTRHPETHIYASAVDEGLNANKMIVPGLGDFGDRYCGTD